MLMAAAGIGRTHGDHMKKDDKLEATYPYDVSKSASDIICQSYSKTYSLKSFFN